MTIFSFIDKILTASDASRAASADDDHAHMELLAQAERRARSTIEAIREGNLVAAVSTLESERAGDELRYESLRFARAEASVGAVGRRSFTSRAQQSGASISR